MTMTKENKRLVIAAMCCLAAGYFISQAYSRPLNPAERRPVLAAIFRVAKSLLWLAAFAEPAPSDHYQSAQHFHHVDDNGVALIDHGQGW